MNLNYRKSLFFVFFILTVLNVQFLAAQAENQFLAPQENKQPEVDTQKKYELFQWDFKFFGGLILSFKDESAIISYGITDSMKEAIMSYKNSSAAYKSYEKKKIAGNIMLWGGMAMICSVLFMPLYSERGINDAVFDNSTKIAAGLVCGGFVMEFIGALLSSSSQENLFNAVKLYNRHKLYD
ncbi:MAG: hypothetical protein LBG79_07445 [Spirochaetaceae bacterium]|jgi:hypothetical protein|nr:hypothetical protein [Spirochaetaceae bacterium]